MHSVLRKAEYMDFERQKQLASKVREDYDALADAMDGTRRSVWSELLPYIPVLPAEAQVLDIGCGNGRMLQALPEYVHYTGIDVSEKLLVKARERYGRRARVEFVTGDATALEQKDASVDFALMIAVLHQIPGRTMRVQALKELSRVLKPGATGLVTVWNLHRPKYWQYLVKGWLMHRRAPQATEKGDVLIPWKGRGVERYYHAYTEKELREDCAAAGVEVMKLEKGAKNFFVQVQAK